MNTSFGIIGKPLTHTFSPAYFNKRFEDAGLDLYYEAFPLDSLQLLSPLLQQQPQLRGFNVTIPYKKAIIPHLDYISEEAKIIGAVNCVRRHEGLLYGYNTDVYGFRESLRPLLEPAKDYQALVLGTGGSSEAVQAALRRLQIPFSTVSSSGNGALSYTQLNEQVIAKHHLIINTTPLGMWPDTENAPALPYAYLTDRHLLFDLIYNPEETQFLRLGKLKGSRIKNGYEMLILQAERSWELWNGEVAETTVKV